MIVEARRALTEVAPELAADVDGVLLIRTATPLVLFFAADAERPLCALQFGDREPLERIHRVLTRLQAVAPDLAPEPIACRTWSGGEAVLVQGGLAGRPWFRLAERVTTEEAWGSVLERALGTLQRLHDVAADVAGWVTEVEPAAELRAVYSRLEGAGVELPAATSAAVEARAGQLEEVGSLRACFQHGDFCLNNLMLRGGGAAVLDFEDFGRTSMPLQDRIGLAFSVAELGAGRGGPSLARAMADCLGGETAFDRNQQLGFVLHYLLWRLELAHGVELRAGKEAHLRGEIERFVADPERFLDRGRAEGRP